MDRKSQPPPEDQEELVHADDAVIGRAFRGSAVALVVIVVAVAGIWLILKRKPAPAPAQLTKLETPVQRTAPPAEVPKTVFTDITKESGVTFAHNNGAYGDKLLPETMGGGVAFLDYDGDGAQDLLFINSTYWPWHVPAGQQPTTPALYHNDGKGHFTDVTAGSGLDISCYGMGVAIGDYDNDGRDDVFITAVGGNHLFHNEGNGKFKEVTAAAAVGGASNDWSTCAITIMTASSTSLSATMSGGLVKLTPKLAIRSTARRAHTASQ